MQINKDRPFTSVLMMSSVDGKILGHTWGDDPAVKKLVDKFEQVHELIGIKAWICGRATIEKDFTFYEKPKFRSGNDTIDRSDFIADPNAASYAIAVDKSGKLGWKSATLLGEHVITVLSEDISNDYLRHLRHIGVSYIFGGKHDLDLALVLRKLKSYFHIDHLMIEGGGKLNGAFLESELVDEFYHILLPIIDGKTSTSTIFEIDNHRRADVSTLLELKDLSRLDDDALLLRYVIKK